MKRTPTPATIEDMYGADTAGKSWEDAPDLKVPGDFRRKGSNGPPMVPDPSPDAALVKSGPRKGLPTLLTYSRPSGFTDLIENGYALEKWKNRTVVAGFGHDFSLATRALGLADQATSLVVRDQDQKWKSDADKLYLDAFRAGGGEWAADLGTFFHAVTEAEHKGVSWLTQLKYGIDLGLDRATVEAMMAVYHACLERHGLVVHGAEIRLVNDEFEVAGTTDLEVEVTDDLTFLLDDGEVITLPASAHEMVISDLKTGSVDPRHCHGYCTQLALYASAEHRFDTETEQRQARPRPINQRWGLILWCPVIEALNGAPRCDLVLVDLELGMALAKVVRRVQRLYERVDGFAMSSRRAELLDESAEPTPVEETDAPSSTAVEVAPQVDISSSEMTRQGLQPTKGERRVTDVDSVNTDPFEGLDDIFGTGPIVKPVPAPVTPESTPELLGNRHVRAMLIRRLENLSANRDAVEVFIAAMQAHDVPRLSTFDGHTGAQLRVIENELIRVEQQFGIDGATVTTPPVDPPNEGRTLTADEFDEIQARYLQLDQTARAAVDTWTLEAQRSGFPIHMKDHPTERRARILEARIACSSIDIDPEMVRAAIAVATGEDWPHLAGITIGAAFGALTIDEARRLIEIAPGLPGAEYQLDGRGAYRMAA